MTNVNHQERAHARLSGSVASIFTECTAAPALWEGRTRTGTAFTREGTAAHEMADLLLTQSAIVGPGSTLEVEGEAITVTDEMVAAVKAYTDFIDGLRKGAEWHAIEQRFTLDALWPEGAPEPMFGSADFVGVTSSLAGYTLDVADLKFGKGVRVKAENSAQLLYYGLGAYLWLHENKPELAIEVTHVRLHIMQPRMADEPDTWEIRLLDLLMWGEEVLKKSVDNITEGLTIYKAGKHCQFCLAKGICPELANEAMKAAKNVFPPIEPEGMSDKDIGEALSRAEVVSAWLNGVRAEAETRLKNGRNVHGWKLVQKKGYRQWADESAVRHAVDHLPGGVFNFLSKPELLSPAQVEKKLKAMGEDPKIIAPFVSTPSTGTTLVPEDDERPAVVTGPQNVFTPMVE